MNKRIWELNEGVEIYLSDPDNSFLKIIETLTRIGYSDSPKTLTQICNLLHKRGRYYIVTYGIMFSLDGKNIEFDIDEWKKQNRIAKMMEDWGLLEIIEPIDEEDLINPHQLKIIKYSEKDKWKLIPKYTMGNNNGYITN